MAAVQHRTLLFAALSLSLLLLLIGSLPQHTEAARSHRLLSKNVVIPSTIGVLTIGVEDRLCKQLPEILPVALPRHRIFNADTHQSFHHYRFAFGYNVTSLAPNDPRIRQYESMLVNSIVAQLTESPGLLTDEFTILTLPVSNELKKWLRDLYQEYYGIQQGGRSAETNAVFILQPSLYRVMEQVKQVSPKKFGGYRLSYDGGVGTSTFVGELRFVVLDLAVDPPTYGPMNDMAGAVDALTIPTIPPLLPELRASNADRSLPRESDRHFQAHLATIVHTAVRHVFSNDMLFSLQPIPNRVLVPIIVFRNHEVFDPWHDFESSAYINATALTPVIQSMFPVGTHVTVVTGMHSIHDHRHISMAVAKAARAKITHKYQNGKYRPTSTHYLDSKMLLLELQHSADVLAQGLLDRNSATYASFFSSSVPTEYLTVSSSSDQAFKRAPKLASAKMPMSDGRTGTRILPVYIFSLDHMDHELTLEDFTKVQAHQNAVIVLQTMQRQLELPFFADESTMTVDMLPVTKEIIAGLAMSIGGVMPPYLRFAPKHNTTVANYLWATGHHPFGAFTKSTGISETFISAVKRNAALFDLDQALHMSAEAITMIDEFARKYSIHTVQEADDDEGVLDILEQLHNEAGNTDEVAIQLSKDTIDHLYAELAELNVQLHEVTRSFEQNHVEDAVKKIALFLTNSKAFAKYTAEQLTLVDEQLRCCKILHVTRGSRETIFDSPVIVILLFCVLPISVGMVYVLRRLRSSRQQQPRAARASAPSGDRMPMW